MSVFNQAKLKYANVFNSTNLYKNNIEGPIKTDLGDPTLFTNTIQEDDPALNIPTYISNNRVNLENNINIDTYMRQSGNYCYSKSKFGLTDIDAEPTWRINNQCDPLLLLFVPRRKDLDWSNYIRNGDKSQGRGFGNTDIDNYVKFSENSRQIYTENVSNMEQNRFYELNRNYMDPKHIVLPFPRGGIDHVIWKNIRERKCNYSF